MTRELWKVLAGLCALVMSAVWAGPAVAQTSEVKAKPPLYSVCRVMEYSPGAMGRRGKGKRH